MKSIALLFFNERNIKTITFNTFPMLLKDNLTERRYQISSIFEENRGLISR